MNRIVFLSALAVLTAASANVVAQEEHEDVFIGVSGGDTAYGSIEVAVDSMNSVVTPNTRVFEAELGEDPNNPFFAGDEPGFNHPESDIPLPAGVDSLVSGDEIFVNQLELIIDGVTAEVFFWDGTGAVSFSPIPGVDFDIFTNPGGSIGAAGAGGGFDDHPEFVLSAGGMLPTPGIYLGSFEAQVNGLNPTDQLFLVMGTEGLVPTDEELEELIELGVEFVETQIIPEPSAAVLALIGGMSLLRRRSKLAS